ncbi:MAG TPA: pyrroline-5-carboxylate reductase [Capsulimonadaceae bacterium]|jgi:pyrroline-5-carboxylate reductase
MSTNIKLAVLGAGKMGGALASGFINGGVILPKNVVLYDAFPAAAKKLAGEIGGSVAESAADAVRGADIVLLAVKPQIMPTALSEIASAVTPDKLIISIAAGVKIAKIEGCLPAGVPVVRVMPNTPALVGAGAASLTKGSSATDVHLATAEKLFSAVGVAVVVDEKLIDAVTGLSGSGPAYAYLIIEALSDGGVKAGLPRDIARKLAAQTMLGASRMVLETGDHPAKLKDDVTTPGGTTAAGLAALERHGVRIALIDAVAAAADRSKELG